MLGMERHGLKLRDPALVAPLFCCLGALDSSASCLSSPTSPYFLTLTLHFKVSEGATVKVWDQAIGTMGSSYVSAYRPGDWQGVYAEAKSESHQWVEKIQDLANKIHAKAMEVRDLKNELELKKIRQGSSSKEVVIKSRFCFLPDSSLWCLLQVLALSEEVAAAKAALTDLKIQDKNLNAYQQALCDLRAAEDHRKPRSQPASPFTSPAMGPTSGALATSGGPPGSPSLAALTDPNFEGSKRLLPGADARKKEFDPIKVSPKWDKPETYQKVRGVRNV